MDERKRIEGIHPVAVVKVDKNILQTYCYWCYLRDRYELIVNELNELNKDPELIAALTKKFIEATLATVVASEEIRMKYLPPEHRNKTFFPSLANDAVFVYTAKGGPLC